MTHSYDYLHEEVRNPKAVEQVARTGLLLAMILAEFQEVKHVGVPGLQVNGEGTLTLATPLVHVPATNAMHLMNAQDVRRGKTTVSPCDQAYCTDTRTLIYSW